MGGFGRGHVEALPIMTGLVVLLFAIVCGAAWYDAEYCLKHEPTGGMTCTGETPFIQCEPTMRCVEWKK